MTVFGHNGWPQGPTQWFELLSCVALALALSTATISLGQLAWPLNELDDLLPGVGAAILTVASIISWILVCAAVKGAAPWKSAWWKTVIAVLLALILVTQFSLPIAQLAASLSEMSR